MKKTYRFILACLMPCGFLFAEPAPRPEPFSRYQDWRFQPVVMELTEDFCGRHYADFTFPTHGPWLLNPAPDSVTVCWTTRIPCGAAIDYRKKGDGAFTRVWRKTYGMADYSSKIHQFHLAGLLPGTEYEYRLVSAASCHVVPNGYAGPYEGIELYSFKTLDPGEDRYRVLVTSDLHGNGSVVLDPMVENTGSTNALLAFFLGDNVADGMGDADYFITSGFLDDVCRLWGKERATVFLRGPADSTGCEAHLWRDYFPRPDGKGHQAFSAGPVLFICLDTMAWQSGTRIDRQMVAECYEEQARWLEGLKKTAAWRDARFRVVMAHYPTHGTEAAVQKAMQGYFKPLLNEEAPERRIHLFIAGHEHGYSRFDPGAAYPKAGRNRNPFPNDHRYAEVICGLCEGLTIDVSREKLVVRSHLYDLPPGTGLRDAFEVLPDGSVRDLMEVETFGPGSR